MTSVLSAPPTRFRVASLASSRLLLVPRAGESRSFSLTSLIMASRSRGTNFTHTYSSKATSSGTAADAINLKVYEEYVGPPGIFTGASKTKNKRPVWRTVLYGLILGIFGASYAISLCVFSFDFFRFRLYQSFFSQVFLFISFSLNLKPRTKLSIRSLEAYIS